MSQDNYGFLAAALAGIGIYESCQRGTGRTERILRQLRDGDKLVVHDHNFKRHVDRTLLEIARPMPKIRVLVAEPGPESMVELMQRGGSGRVLFDHEWIRQFFVAELQRSLRLFEGMAGAQPEEVQPATIDVLRSRQ